jgi:hypothetical protein
MIVYQIFSTLPSGAPTQARLKVGSVATNMFGTLTSSEALAPLSINSPGTILSFAAGNQGGQVHVLAVGQDGGLYHSRIKGDDWQQQWGRISTVIPQPGHHVDAACAGDADELHVLTVTADGKLWHSRRATNGKWLQNFGNVGEALSMGATVFRKVAASCEGEVLHVVALDDQGRIWHSRRSAKGNWLQQFGEVTGAIGKPAAFTDVACDHGGGELAVTALASTGTLYLALRADSGAWKDNRWWEVGGPYTHVSVQKGNQVLLTVRNAAGEIWGLSRDPVLRNTTWKNLTSMTGTGGPTMTAWAHAQATLSEGLLAATLAIGRFLS